MKQDNKIKLKKARILLEKNDYAVFTIKELTVYRHNLVEWGFNSNMPRYPSYASLYPRKKCKS